jgi:peptidoglycan/xylan/chitin deacetylase (PgdA/CDA1 family)
MRAYTLKSLGRSALHSLRVVDAVRAIKRRGCRILVYHRFPEDRSSLIAQCEHIRRYYQPVSMRRLAESLGTGPPLPDNAIAITVDDGHHDFLTSAQPVFSTYGIAATVFVVTDFIDGKGWLWFDQVEYIFDHTSRASIRFAGCEFHIESDRKRAACQLNDVLTRMPHADLLGTLGMLQRQLGVPVPDHPSAEYKLLSWDDVRKLAADGVEFGSHTRSHPILSKIFEPAELQKEIVGSKKRLDEELGFSALHFCYPNGTRADYDGRTIAFVKDCGFVTAVTAESGFNYATTDPFQLFRLGVDPALPHSRFVELLAGLRKY